MPETTIYPRHIAQSLAYSLEYMPIVLLQGPRQCGKTTLALSVCAPDRLRQEAESAHSHSSLQTLIEIAEDWSYEYVSLDDDETRAWALEDPVGFVAELPERVILDEAQRAPELFSAIDLEVRRNRVPGRFVIISSNALPPNLADRILGMETMQIQGLAQDEMDARFPRADPPERVFELRSGFLDALFSADFRIERTERLGPELRERIVRGGFPAAIEKTTGRRRTAWHRSYFETHVRQDASELARLRDPGVIPALLQGIAARTAVLYNLSDLASPFRLSRQSVGKYVSLLEKMFLVEKLRPWSLDGLDRLVKTPKLHIADTGLGCALLGLDESGLAADRGALGRMLETFVYQELRRQASRETFIPSFFHYRDKDGVKVDIVLERQRFSLDGLVPTPEPTLVAGVEVKAAATVRISDFRGLRKLRRLAGDRFAAGVVLYDGEATVGWGDRLYAVPIRKLWETPLPQPNWLRDSGERQASA